MFEKSLDVGLGSASHANAEIREMCVNKVLHELEDFLAR